MSCQMRSPRGICASSSLLVPVSWLATLIILTYSLTICITSITHSTSLPSIWTTPVSAVPWFGSGAAPSAARTRSKAFLSPGEESCAVTKYIAERWEKLSGIEHQSSGPILFSIGRQSTIDSARPAWARRQKTRRGLDNPFTKPSPLCEEQPAAPPPPPRTHLKETVAPRDSHYVEVCRQSDSSSALTLQTPTVFPKTTDPDLPIPLPRLSEWIHADAAKEIAVHTKPPMLP